MDKKGGFFDEDVGERVQRENGVKVIIHTIGQRNEISGCVPKAFCRPRNEGEVDTVESEIFAHVPPSCIHFLAGQLHS